MLLPLREAQDDREIRPGRAAHRLDDLDCEAGAADQVAALLGAVDLNAVESQTLRVRGRSRYERPVSSGAKTVEGSSSVQS